MKKINIQLLYKLHKENIIKEEGTYYESSLGIRDL